VLEGGGCGREEMQWCFAYFAPKLTANPRHLVGEAT
jgi:hypothetical protein